MNAREQLAEALREWDAHILMPGSLSEALANSARRMLAEPSVELTAEQRETVERSREICRGLTPEFEQVRLLAIIDSHFPPPAPAIKPGQRVRWWRGEDSGTGRYDHAPINPGIIYAGVVIGPPESEHYMSVDRVEPLEP